MVKLFVLTGLPASGKSKIGLQLAINNNGIIHSSDQIRYELFGDEGFQGDNNKVFEELNKRIKRDLGLGINVVFDATNLVAKRRKAFLNNLGKIQCEKIAVVVVTPYQICIERDKLRSRSVGEDVIIKMLKQFQLPMKWEGFDEIQIIDNYKENPFKFCKTAITATENYCQENKNHALTLDKHMEIAMHYCLSKDYPLEVLIASQYHDIGKPLCKSFYNGKNEKVESATFYGHENVSAYLFLTFLVYDFAMEIQYITALINYHMIFYRINTEKERQKYIDRFGIEFFEDLKKVNEADLFAH